MKNKILLLAAAALVLTLALDRALIKPVLADVRAALVQNVDESARSPFADAYATTSTYASFTVPAGKRYIVEQYTASCDVDNTASLTDVNILGTTAGTEVQLATAPHFIQPNGSVSGHAVNSWRATGTGRFYADPGSLIQVSIRDSNQGLSTRDCRFFITGYFITL